MPFQTRKSFVHIQNTNEDLYNEISELSVPPFIVHATTPCMITCIWGEKHTDTIMFKYCTESSTIVCPLYCFGFSFKILTLNEFTKKYYTHIHTHTHTRTHTHTHTHTHTNIQLTNICKYTIRMQYIDYVFLSYYAPSFNTL